MLRTKISFFIIIITAFLLLTGCETVSKTEGEDYAPEWANNLIESNTVDDKYFVGIGISNTGNENADLDFAKKLAFSDLTSVIFESIKKSQEHILPANAEEKYFDSAEAHIVQSLSRNFMTISTDALYINGKGYWFYYKILKTDWEKIQKEEEQEIANFIEEVISPKLLSKETTDVELLTSLFNGWKFLAESPYPELVFGALVNDRGILIDLIENNIAKVFSRLAITIGTDNISTELGRSENFSVMVSDKGRRKIGELKIDLYNKANNQKITEIITEKDGHYSDNVEFKNLQLGKQKLYAQVSMSYLEIDPKLFKKEITAPVKEFTVIVNEMSVVLKLVVNGEADIQDFIDQTKALFTKKELELRLSPGTRGERYTIIFTIYFRNQPRNFHNLYITNAIATVELLKEDNSIFSYKSQEYREVGLDWSRAQERVSIKMFRDINRDELFFKELHKAIYADYF